MKIYLIRHGESTSDIKQKYDGDYDDHLTGKGLQEAEEIAEKLIRSNIQIIFSSSKIRALETSKIIGEKFRCQITVIDDLTEQDIYGAYVQLGKNQSEEEYRKLGELLVNREHAVQGAETYKHFKDRIIRCFSKITSEKFKTIAIVTHGGPIRSIFREILILGEFKQIGNGAIIELEKKGSHLSVIKMDNANLE
jgi:broad specificity phosphatase PhoE